MGEETTRANNSEGNREIESVSGWVTTQQAARALDITARTVRWHIEKGNLEAIPRGEGVKRTWLVSIDSLQAFRDSRQVSGGLPQYNRVTEDDAVISPDIPGNPIRELADRLAEEAARAAEYRVRLELTEQAQSTLEAELGAERVRREQAERERDVLAAELEALRETRDARETASEDVGGTETPAGDTGQPRGRSSWWRRFFGFE
jgi:hypothetical protein